MSIFGCKCRYPKNSPQYPNFPSSPQPPNSPTSQDPDDPDAPAPGPPGNNDPGLPYLMFAGCLMLIQAAIGVYVFHMPLYPEADKGPPLCECKCIYPEDIVPDIPYDGSRSPF